MANDLSRILRESDCEKKTEKQSKAGVQKMHSKCQVKVKLMKYGNRLSLGEKQKTPKTA